MLEVGTKVKVTYIEEDVSPFDGYEDYEQLEQDVMNTDVTGTIEYQEDDDLWQVYFEDLDVYGSFYTDELEAIGE